MHATMGSSLLQLLRILTPYEVFKLSNEVCERKKQQELIAQQNEVEAPLITSTEVADDGQQAKILSFNQTAQESIEVKEVRQDVKKIPTIKEKEDKFLLSIGAKKSVVRTSRKVVGGEDFDDEDQPPKEEQVSTTIFLLQEKEKIRKSQLKLVGQDALKTYKSQAAIDTTHEDKEDLSQSSSSGILVNKRQF